MAKPQYRNGPDLSPSVEARKRRRLLAAISFATENWRTLGGFASAIVVGGGLAALLPVRHYEFDAFKQDITAKVDSHSTAINDIKEDVRSIRSTTETILFRLTPPAPVPAAIQESPPPRKKVSRPKPASGFTRIFGR